MSGETSKKSFDRMRSPAYPHSGLAEAVGVVELLAAMADASHTVSLADAAVALGLKPKSSWLNLRLASLKKFGLIEDLPGGETRARQLRLTTTARILASLPPGDPIHRVMRKQAALRPPIYEDLWNRFGPILPGNVPMREYLVQERQFNPQSVEALLDNFRSTVEYAGLIQEALSFEELAEAIGADQSEAARARSAAAKLQRSIEPTEEITGPVLGQTLLGQSTARLRAMGEKMEIPFGRRTTAIPLDGCEDAILELPREMTAQRWQTIIDTLELWKKQAQKAES